MANPRRPDVTTNENQTLYHSLDVTDQGVFNGLTSKTDRNKFLEMVQRSWLDEDAEQHNTLPVDGQYIVDRWNTYGRRIRRVRKRPTAAIQAVAPLVVHIEQPAGIQIDHSIVGLTAVSPPQSPLAELSPRFACQGDENRDIQLSPTKGQADFIAANLNAPWKFADVVFQKEPMSEWGRVPLAPTTSVCLLVRPREDGHIEEQLAVKYLEVNELVGGPDNATPEVANAAVQREVNVHQLVGLTQCSHVIKYRGHSIRTSDSHVIRPNDDEVRNYKRKTVHLYQDFAGSGNLEHLIDRHREKNKPINEHFIWYVLRELTEALVALHRGPGYCTKPHTPVVGLPASGEYLALSVPPWLPILHLDIKTDNVFLETNNAEYPAYPKPVLADFGVSCQGTEKIIDLKHCNGTPEHVPRFAGTSGWHPPERHDGALKGAPVHEGLTVDPDYAPYEWQLSGKSDVWASGLIVHKMMYAHRTDTVNDPKLNETVSVEDYTLSNEGTWKDILRKDKIHEHQSHFEVSTANISHLPDGYSARLCLLAMQCMRHDIEDRPDLEQLLNLCQQELTRLDNLPSSTAGKRKRDDHGDDESTLLVGKESWNRKFSKYSIGEIYQPRHPRTKVDLTVTHPYRGAYSQIVNAWSAMPRPTPAGQDIVIDAINWYLLDYQNDHAMVNSSDHPDRTVQEYDWAVKYLVSCLRKRSNSQGGAYVLTTEYIEDHSGSEWIDTAFEPEVKIKILEHLLTIDEFWNHASILDVEKGQEALGALKNALDWGLMMLRDTVTPVVVNATGSPTGSSPTAGNPAEPREPRMKDQSALHKGIFDWIFVKPSGAFYKG